MMSNYAHKHAKKCMCPSPRTPSPPSGRRISPRGEGVLSGDSGSEIAPRSDPSPAAESPAQSRGPFSLTGQNIKKKQLKRKKETCRVV